jgi:hypothetical protein
MFSNVFQDYWKFIYKLARTFTLIKKKNASHKLEEIGWMVDEIFFSFEFKS